jgi:hypothetical protein
VTEPNDARRNELVAAAQRQWSGPGVPARTVRAARRLGYHPHASGRGPVTISGAPGQWAGCGTLEMVCAWETLPLLTLLATKKMAATATTNKATLT